MVRFLLQDLRRNRELLPGQFEGTVRTVLTLRFASVLLFRLSQAAGRRSGAVGGLVKQVNQLVTGADIAWQANVGSGLVLQHPSGVVIGPGVILGRGVVVQQGVTVGGHGRWAPGSEVSPRIGDDVMLGAGAKCIGSLRIGDRALVGANAVVLGDVPDDSTAVGVPARVVGAARSS